MLYEGGHMACVLEVITFDAFYHHVPMYRVLLASGIEMVLEEVWFKPWEEPSLEPVCECGALHTDKPNVHYNWCPLAT